MVKAESLEREAILSAIRRGELYASEGPDIFVERKGNKIIVDTTPCQVIGIQSSTSWSKGRVLRGDGVTHFEYEIADERWLRVECIDKDGKHGWSQIIIP